MATREVSEEDLMCARDFGYSAIAAGAEHLSVRPLGDGRAVYLCPMFGGNLRLAIGWLGSESYDDLWCYQDGQGEAAWRAALGWDGEGEPEGWYRHPDTGRRRPEGNAAREVVHW